MNPLSTIDAGNSALTSSFDVDQGLDFIQPGVRNCWLKT